MTRLATLFLVLLATASCNTLLRGRPGPYFGVDEENAEHHLELAKEDMSAGNLDRALDRLVAIRDVDGLVPEVRARAENLVERCAELVFAEHARGEIGTRGLEKLFESELPTRLRARAGILAAERMLAEGHRVSAVKMVKKVDRVLSTHPERALAGDVVARAGMSLIADDGRYGLFFRYRTKGISALEYLILHYPRNPNCPRAYSVLAATYEERGSIDLAIERCDDLLYYHPEHPETVVAEARLPYLRLRRLERNDLDRVEMLQARAEIARWLARHPGHELEGWVTDLALECDRRLFENDMSLSRYYARIGSAFGARLHANRALAQAEEAGLLAHADEARTHIASLASLPEVSGEATWEDPESTFDEPEEIQLEP